MTSTSVSARAALQLVMARVAGFCPNASALPAEHRSCRCAGTGHQHAVPPVRPFRLPPRIGVETEKEITLEQALAMALANNKDIEASRIDRLESDYS